MLWKNYYWAIKLVKLIGKLLFICYIYRLCGERLENKIILNASRMKYE